MSSLKNNYYVSSIFWSTFQKILNAVVGFISVPLLLGYYGKVEYGILGIATACNGYMHLLDLGMDTGAVKFYSQWRTEGKKDLINHVARTNITFYGIISIINILGLVALAIWGEGLFAVDHEQFLLLRSCLLIIAAFCLFSWGTTTFNQLLIADMQMAFAMQVQSVIAVMKAILIAAVFYIGFSLKQYFFLLSCVVALTIVPYALRCKKYNLISSLIPAFYWKDFRIVILFSLSIFALSLFQITATQSRPIILSIFAENGADAVADFRIIEVVPNFIIMIGGAFTSVFLPKTSAMLAKGNKNEIFSFAYKWTKYTTIIVNILSVPVALCATEVMIAYVGKEYEYLSIWLIIWCSTVLIQMHTTPGNALVLATGKTKLLVVTTSISCLSSILLNIFLAPYYGVGAAVISYFMYVVIVIGLYYIGYYKKLFGLSRRKMFMSFAKPTLISIILFLLVKKIQINYDSFYFLSERLTYVLICIVKSFIWLILYSVIILGLRVVKISEFKR